MVVKIDYFNFKRSNVNENIFDSEIGVFCNVKLITFGTIWLGSTKIHLAIKKLLFLFYSMKEVFQNAILNKKKSCVMYRS